MSWRVQQRQYTIAKLRNQARQPEAARRAVELAWRLVRFQPDYHPVRKWRQILAKGALATGAARKKAIVAVARQLTVDLWRIKTGRLRAEELGLIN
ncbi:MAG TPA: hypothetical protein VNY07_14380 [Chthoniobacterales bacterium]|jgi:hypothetical protein|nr:hypothetical protein [Chthoniobacterales bacterium]